MEDKLRNLEYGVKVLSSVASQKQVPVSIEGSCQEECYFSSIEGEYFDVNCGHKDKRMMDVGGMLCLYWVLHEMSITWIIILHHICRLYVILIIEIHYNKGEVIRSQTNLEKGTLNGADEQREVPEEAQYGSDSNIKVSIVCAHESMGI